MPKPSLGRWFLQQGWRIIGPIRRSSAATAPLQGHRQVYDEFKAGPSVLHCKCHCPESDVQLGPFPEQTSGGSGPDPGCRGYQTTATPYFINDFLINLSVCIYLMYKRIWIINSSGIKFWNGWIIMNSFGSTLLINPIINCHQLWFHDYIYI